MARTAAAAGPSSVSSPAPKVVTVKLFKSLHQGFGDADDVRSNHRVEDYNTRVNTPLRYNRVHGSIDARWPGELRMGLQVKKIATVSHDLSPVFAIEWVDVVNNVYPAIYYLVGRKVQKIRFGTVTEVGTNSLGTANATGGMFDDDGSGVPYLYACFGGVSSNNKIVRMTVAGVFTTASTVVADKLLSLNGDAYRTIQPTSGTATCQVSKCPYGSDRFTAASWSTGVTVGFAGTSINVLTAVRQAPVAVKPEGIFAYNAGLDRWINYTHTWRQFLHSDNGKGAFFLGDSLVVPMGDGGAFIFDGNNARPFDPGGLLATPNVHTTKNKFAAVGAMRHWLIGATQGGAKQIFAGTSLRFQYFNSASSGTYTDDSTSVRDADLTTSSVFTLKTSDFVYVGWDRPFTTIRYDTGLANTNVATLTLAIGTTAGSPGTYTSISFVDGTGLAGAPLGQSGTLYMKADPVAAGWVKTTVNGISAYWARISTSALLTSVGWVNCLISPWYPSVNNADFPLDGLDRAGNFPHLLFGRNDQAAGPLWHDMVSLPEPDEIGAVVFGNVGGSSLNQNRNLVIIGRFNIWRLEVAPDDRPGTAPAPFIADAGLLEGASTVPSFSGASGGAAQLVRLKEVRIQGHEMDPTLVGNFYYSWDYGKPWSNTGPKFTHFPAVSSPKSTSADEKGLRFRWAIGFVQTAASALLSQPVVTDIEADFELVAGVDIDSVPERAVATPPRF